MQQVNLEDDLPGWPQDDRSVGTHIRAGSMKTVTQVREIR